VAWLLLLVYGLTLVFSLRTHRSLYEVAQLDLALEAGMAETSAAAERAGPEITEAPGGHGHRPQLLPWLLVLLGATAGIAYESELFVGVVETVSEGFGLSGLFTGVVLLPLLGGVAEYITAVGMAQHISIMVLAVMIAVGFMMLFAGAVSDFVNKHPTVKMLALSFLLMIGTALIGEGMHFHIPKGYIYFAMGFSVFVELLNLKAQKKHKKIADVA
jgi:calcium/proton exchanger cax